MRKDLFVAVLIIWSTLYQSIVLFFAVLIIWSTLYQSILLFVAVLIIWSTLYQSILLLDTHICGVHMLRLSNVTGTLLYLINRYAGLIISSLVFNIYFRYIANISRVNITTINVLITHIIDQQLIQKVPVCYFSLASARSINSPSNHYIDKATRHCFPGIVMLPP